MSAVIGASRAAPSHDGVGAVAHVDVVGEAGWLAAGKLTAGEASRDGEAGFPELQLKPASWWDSSGDGEAGLLSEALSARFLLDASGDREAGCPVARSTSSIIAPRVIIGMGAAQMGEASSGLKASASRRSGVDTMVRTRRVT